LTSLPIERHWEGIAAYCRLENKVSLGFVEGLNNKIRVIQRRPYELRKYRRLKILQGISPQLSEMLSNLTSGSKRAKFPAARPRPCE
jgi:hypothetical protein